jgi:hypothetical protein
MTIQDSLIEAVLQAKCWVACVSSNNLQKEKHGDSILCCEKKVFLMQSWIKILEEYNCQNFDENGSIEPDYPCLSQNEIIELIGKVKSLIK